MFLVMLVLASQAKEHERWTEGPDPICLLYRVSDPGQSWRGHPGVQNEEELTGSITQQPLRP